MAASYATFARDWFSAELGQSVDNRMLNGSVAETTDSSRVNEFDWTRFAAALMQTWRKYRYLELYLAPRAFDHFFV